MRYTKSGEKGGDLSGTMPRQLRGVEGNAETERPKAEGDSSGVRKRRASCGRKEAGLFSTGVGRNILLGKVELDSQHTEGASGI